MESQGEGWEKIAKGIMDMLIIREEDTWENRKTLYKALGMNSDRGNDKATFQRLRRIALEEGTADIERKRRKECYRGEAEAINIYRN